jgi:hypothetical protein
VVVSVYCVTVASRMNARARRLPQVRQPDEGGEWATFILNVSQIGTSIDWGTPNRENAQVCAQWSGVCVVSIVHRFVSYTWVQVQEPF